MESNNYLEEVRKQYEDYPFPEVDPDLEFQYLQVTPQDNLAKINHYCFEGKRDLTKGCRFLVAGGGTGHTVIYLAEQLRNSDCEIVYLDLSEASMKVAQQRAANRGLTNIRWINGSLLDLPKLQVGQFDYINCVGVLHHLENPTDGLVALREVLKPDGAMGLMVYGKYGRAGIYAIQDLMQRINQNDPDHSKNVDRTKRVLLNLPRTNWYMRGMNRQSVIETFIEDDNNLYDTFLHSQDRAYTVPELYDWIENSELVLNSFTNYNCTQIEKLKYLPQMKIEDPVVRSRINNLPIREQQAIAELVTGDMSLHTFYVSFRRKTAANPRDLNNVPFFLPIHVGGKNIFASGSGPDIAKLVKESSNNLVDITHPTTLNSQFEVEQFTPYLFKYMDGERTLQEIFECVQSEPEFQENPPVFHALLREFKNIYHLLNQIDWLHLRDKSVPRHRSYEEMQQPISKQGNPNRNAA